MLSGSADTVKKLRLSPKSRPSVPLTHCCHKPLEARSVLAKNESVTGRLARAELVSLTLNSVWGGLVLDDGRNFSE